MKPATFDMTGMESVAYRNTPSLMIEASVCRNMLVLIELASENAEEVIVVTGSTGDRVIATPNRNGIIVGQVELAILIAFLEKSNQEPSHLKHLLIRLFNAHYKSTLH
ncbi:hypothetical protein KUW19_17595 [Ferrimonas balearica]|uniref:hypothetical protein n=1 Tax=Ferrimonas balearica TaxID=44012 RepID=UPI001C9794B9|nr:hypothetical protein [Ferrimonas balearica]MBY6108278.1 hypothetical protein [Ferrimonas balearica]